MKKIFLKTLVTLLALISLHQASAQGTAFTYQGRLDSGGSPATGLYDLEFSLSNALAGGAQIGATVTNLAVGVTNGLFTTALDFGSIFTGHPLWLAIGVRTNGAGGFTGLAPLQQLTPTPYAIFANTASNLSGLLPATQLSGALPGGNLSGTYGNPVTLNNTGNNFAGSFTGNGVNLTNVNAASVNGLSATNFWQLGGNNVAAGQFIGTTNNQPLQFCVNGQRGLRLEFGGISTLFGGTVPSGAPNVIGGAPVNYVTPGVVGTVIGGGGAMNISGTSVSNSIGSESDFSVIGGGLFNVIQTVAEESVIGGGADNLMGHADSFSTIGGGGGNIIQQFSDTSTIAGGGNNVIFASAGSSTIGGGQDNFCTNTGATIGGGGYDGRTYAGNTAGGAASTIGGGLGNQANFTYDAVGGGAFNSAGGNSSTIGGGLANVIQTGADFSFIAGGDSNLIQSAHSVIAGGFNNFIQTNSMYASIGGGYNNAMYGQTYSGDGSTYATIGGGVENLVAAAYATVGGGFGNNAYGDFSTVAGGEDGQTSGVNGAIGGGYGNYASGDYSVVPGGNGNTAAGQYSFAAGQQAFAGNEGDFVWADSQNATFFATANDQFCIRAQGGVKLDNSTSIAFGNRTRQMLELYRDPTSTYIYGIGVQNGTFYTRTGTNGGFAWYQGGAHNDNLNNAGGGKTLMLLDASGNLRTTSGVIASLSDRNAKTDFKKVDAQAMLARVVALPVTTWRYKTADPAQRHLGPMAQDFYAAFNVGLDDKSICSVDEDGVALAAIQGLNQKVDEKDAEIQTLKNQNDSFSRQLDDLRAVVNSLMEKK